MNNYICTNEKAAAMCTHDRSTCVWGTLDTRSKIDYATDDVSDKLEDYDDE